jgi:hypothetical protein
MELADKPATAKRALPARFGSAENLPVIRCGNSLWRLVRPTDQMTIVMKQLLAAATARLVQRHHDQLKYCQRRIVDLRRIARG